MNGKYKTVHVDDILFLGGGEATVKNESQLPENNADNT